MLGGKTRKLIAAGSSSCPQFGHRILFAIGSSHGWKGTNAPSLTLQSLHPRMRSWTVGATYPCTCVRASLTA